jgi:dsRNA-specific ribonuclease
MSGEDICPKAKLGNCIGVLNHYCQLQKLPPPVYEVSRQGGPQNAPNWTVTVKYGNSTYTMPEPIQGSKQDAKQMAAKQVLEFLEFGQESFPDNLSDVGSDGSIDSFENYKGILSQYCAVLGLTHPVYKVERRSGPSNAPTWTVTVKYGDSTYTTPVPIQGNKRHAAQMVAKQVLEAIKLRVCERVG